MKKMMLAGLAALTVAAPATAVTYTFTQATNQSFVFTLSTPDFISSTQVFQPNQLDFHSSNVGSVEFCLHGTTCSMLPSDPVYDEITVAGAPDPNAPPITLPDGTVIPAPTVGGSYYYTQGAFSTYGAYISGPPNGVQGVPLTVTPSVVTPRAVPEPATWAMMISGFGMVGAGMRRRRASVSFA